MFKLGNFKLHSGTLSNWLIDCDCLTDEDWETLAYLIAQRCSFSKIVGIPRGGLKLASTLEKYITTGKTLIVDDVLTTGTSFEEMKRKVNGEPIGFVVFSRGICPSWVKALFQFN